MATIFRSRRPAEPRSGGKILRTRRPAAARTPYDRPSAPNPPPENPSWLARFVFPPTRFIASGAGKILSSVFSPDSDSSSSSSSGSDSSSEDEYDDGDTDNEISSQRADDLNEDGELELVERFRKEANPTEKIETKRVIEELLMQVTFTREESDKLIRIVKSRTVGSLIIEDVEDGRPIRTLDSDGDTPDLCNTAVLEAKKWLEEKKLESSSKSEFDLGIHTLSSTMLPNMTEGNEGSPVDVAKSYMRVRPPWASPSINHTEFKSPSPRGVQLFREETPFTIGGNSMSSSKVKRNFKATGPWNIQEEIRRVRSKATEEMLRTPPSAKIDWSALAIESKSSLNSLVADKLEAHVEDRIEKSSNSMEPSLTLATGMTASHQFPVLEQNGALSSNPANCVPMDLEATQVIERKEGLHDDLEDILTSEQKLQSADVEKTLSHDDANAGETDNLKDATGTNQQTSSKIEETVQGSSVFQDNNYSTSNVVGTGGPSTENGFPSPGSNVSAGLDTEKGSRPFDEEYNIDDSSHEKVAPTAHAEKTCELLSETSVEVPITNENDSVASGSQNSSSVRNEELPEDPVRPNTRSTVTGNVSEVGEKQQEKKANRSRRGRGRGK